MDENNCIWQGQKVQADKFQFYNRYLASHLMPYIGKHILDIGVGIGNVTEALIGKTESYIGLDVVAEHIEIARDRFRHRSFKGFPVNVESCGSLDILEGETVDTIISVNCFEHIKNDVLVMSILCDWALPETKFVFLVPAHQQLYGAWIVRLPTTADTIKYF